MKKIIWLSLFLSNILIYAQDPAHKISDSILVITDTINNIPVYKKVAKTDSIKGEQVLQKINLSNIDTGNLNDLEEAKRYDSLWYKFLYKPVLFDSINTLKAKIVQKGSPIILDTTILKNQLERLNQKTQLNIVYNPILARTIQAFLKSRKKSLGKLFKIADYYFPIFEEKLVKYDIPLEMKYLAIVESALNPRAVSRAGAGGLWQFMYSTGKMYGLEINSYVDERFDPIQSTEAACKHMQDLYKVFKDWNLVLAAYNSGAGNVTKAIRRSGGYKNYWNIRPYLPRETASYVPLFEATLFLGEYANEYGIDKEVGNKFHYIATDTVRVKKTLTFDQISKLLKMSTAELEFLNPQYKLNIIPYVEDKNYTLKLPVELVGVFVNNEPEIYAYVQKELNRREKPLPKFYKFKNYTVYRVRPGDFLGKIARRYHVSISKIKRWNRLRSNRLRVGQKLKIYSRHAMIVSAKSKQNKTSKSKLKSSFIIYKVKPGDTLWDISRKYKISVTDIKRWNKLKSSDKLRPGMKLKIRKS